MFWKKENEQKLDSHSRKEIKRIERTVKKIESYRESMRTLTDEQLQHKTIEFKERLAEGESLDSLLPEAYAAIREADKRVLGMEPFRVQLIGGIILHQGRIAEMKTGEGKTLVATLPAYLNALEGKGVLLFKNMHTKMVTVLLLISVDTVLVMLSMKIHMYIT